MPLFMLSFCPSTNLFASTVWGGAVLSGLHQQHTQHPQTAPPPPSTAASEPQQLQQHPSKQAKRQCPSPPGGQPTILGCETRRAQSRRRVVASRMVNNRQYAQPAFQPPRSQITHPPRRAGPTAPRALSSCARNPRRPGNMSRIPCHSVVLLQLEARVSVLFILSSPNRHSSTAQRPRSSPMSPGRTDPTPARLSQPVSQQNTSFSTSAVRFLGAHQSHLPRTPPCPTGPRFRAGTGRPSPALFRPHDDRPRRA